VYTNINPTFRKTDHEATVNTIHKAFTKTCCATFPTTIEQAWVIALATAILMTCCTPLDRGVSLAI